jgi:sec-independent protein translocase protein TatB
MEIFGIGPQELFFILLIAIIVLGPKDMQKAGKTVGRWLNRFMRSDGWRAFQRASREIRSMPTTWMREANLEELKDMDREIRNAIDPRPPAARPPRPQSPPNQTAPSPETKPVETEPPAAASPEPPSPADNTDPGNE